MSRINSLLGIVCIALFVFTLNFILPSDLNGWKKELNFSLSALSDDTLLDEEVNWRYTNSEFGRRPLVVNLVRYGVQYTGWSYITVFVLIQLVGYFLSIAAALRLSYRMASRAGPAATYLPFLLLFPQVFLFVAHAHTFDDLYQYTALLLVLLGLVQGQYVLIWSCLVAACLIRETSLLFLPVTAYLLYRLRNWAFVPAGLFVGSAATGAVLLLGWYLPPEQLSATVEYAEQRRFAHWMINFGTPSRISESLWLPVFILGPFVYLLWQYWTRLTQQPLQRYFVHSFVFLALVNTLLVWVAAITAEARLFLPPVLLILPVLAPVWDALGMHTVQALKNWQWSDLAVTGISILAVQLLYHPSVGGTGYAFRAYALAWTLAMVVLWRSTRLTPSRSILR